MNRSETPRNPLGSPKSIIVLTTLGVVVLLAGWHMAHVASRKISIEHDPNTLAIIAPFVGISLMRQILVIADANEDLRHRLDQITAPLRVISLFAVAGYTAGHFWQSGMSDALVIGFAGAGGMLAFSFVSHRLFGSDT